MPEHDADTTPTVIPYDEMRRILGLPDPPYNDGGWITRPTWISKEMWENGIDPELSAVPLHDLPIPEPTPPPATVRRRTDFEVGERVTVKTESGRVHETVVTDIEEHGDTVKYTTADPRYSEKARYLEQRWLREHLNMGASEMISYLLLTMPPNEDGSKITLDDIEEKHPVLVRGRFGRKTPTTEENASFRRFIEDLNQLAARCAELTSVSPAEIAVANSYTVQWRDPEVPKKNATPPNVTAACIRESFTEVDEADLTRVDTQPEVLVGDFYRAIHAKWNKVLHGLTSIATEFEALSASSARAAKAMSGFPKPSHTPPMWAHDPARTRRKKNRGADIRTPRV